jgi:hypothetical protein
LTRNKLVNKENPGAFQRYRGLCVLPTYKGNPRHDFTLIIHKVQNILNRKYPPLTVPSGKAYEYRAVIPA